MLVKAVHYVTEEYRILLEVVRQSGKKEGLQPKVEDCKKDALEMHWTDYHNGKDCADCKKEKVDPPSTRIVSLSP